MARAAPIRCYASNESALVILSQASRPARMMRILIIASALWASIKAHNFGYTAHTAINSWDAVTRGQVDNETLIV